MARSFTLCPWNAELLEYLFVHFSDDRKSVYTAAQRFSVDLSAAVEDILAQEYDETAQSSEVAAQAAKERILNHMREYGVSESQTLDRLKVDCLRHLCKDCATADETACNRLVEEVRQYQAQEKLKPPFFEMLEERIEEIWTEELEQICQRAETADEAACNRCIEEINCHKASDNLKAPYVQKMEKRIQEIWTDELSQTCSNYETADESACENILAAIKRHKASDSLKVPFSQKIQSRLESIWSVKDEEIFDNLYIKTDITNPRAVVSAAAYETA